MKQEMKSTARLAVTAGLCTSLALGGLPLEAIAAEVVVEPVQAAAATAANATEDSGEGLTSSDPTPADDAAADEGAAEDDGAAGAGDDAKGEATATGEGPGDKAGSADTTNGAPQDAATFSAVPASAADPKSTDVAQVIAADGTVRGAYGSLNTAVDAVQDGDTVKLLKDTADSCIVNDIAMTFDLNGKTLTAKDGSDCAFKILGGNLTVRDSSVHGRAPLVSADYKSVDYEGSGKILASKVAVRIYRGGTMTLESGAVDSIAGVAIFAGSTSQDNGNGHLSVKGGYIHAYSAAVAFFAQGTTVNVSGGVIASEENAPLLGNGTSHGTEATVSGGTLISRCTTDGYNACGIYHPQAGKLTITGGNIFADGGAGVLMRAGSAYISGGTITASGTEAGRVGDKDAEVPCSGVVVDHTSEKYPGEVESDTVTISGNAVIRCDAALPAVQVMASDGESVKGDIVITGGTFDGGKPDDALIDDELQLEKGDDGSFVVVEKKVAQIGDKTFPSLAKALDAAQDGDTVMLLENEDISGSKKGVVVASGKALILNLNGKELKVANTSTGSLKVLGELTVRDSTDMNRNGTGSGRIYTTTEYTGGSTGYAMLSAVDGGKVIVDSGHIDAASFTTDHAHKGQFALGVDSNKRGSSIVVNGGKIEAGWYAVSGNGNHAVHASSIVVNGGELISAADYAVYHPQLGSLEINGGVVYGQAGGIALNRGTLLVTDGIVTSKGRGDTGSWGDGTGGLGNAAINVEAKYGETSAKIEGGKIVAEGNALTLNKNADHDASIAVSGGSFSQAVPREFCSPGYEPADDGKGNYTVEVPEKNRVAEIDGRAYPSVQEALDAAKDGQTVKLLKDVAENVVIAEGKNVVLDLGGSNLAAPLTDGANKTSAITVKGSLVLKDSTAKDAPVVNADGSITYVSGSVVCPKPTVKPYARPVIVEPGGSFTLESGGLYAEDSDGVFVGTAGAEAGGSMVMKGGLIDAQEYGIGVISHSSLIVKGGLVRARNNAAVAGNGAVSPSQGDTNIAIKGGLLRSESTSSSYIACGVYHPQAGTLTVTGGKIEAVGGVGILMRAGSANITGGEIVATGSMSGYVGDSKVEKVPSSGIVVDRAANYGASTEDDVVNVSGSAMIKADKGQDALSAVLDESDSKKGLITVSGGELSSKPDLEYCADGYGPVQQPDGSFGVSTEQSYTVKHLFEAVDSDGYVEDEALAKTETLTGTIGRDTAAKAMDVEGFAAQPVEQKTIAADGSTVVEIRYDRTRHTVSFDSKGGTDVTERTGVKYGAKAVEPADPTKEGSTFLGWYVSGTFNKFDFNAPVTEDIQLVAHWVLNTYAVTLDANGGEPIEPIEMSHGYELIEPTATRTGYKLTGWKDADGKDVTFPVTVTGDLKLTAQWKLDAPKVALTADKAEPGVHAGDTVTLTANPEHALGGVTYTYQWYKGREKIDGATEKTLEVSNRDGEYTVDVVAHDGRDASAAATSNSITLLFERQGVAVSFAQADVEKHANEIGTTFANGVTLRVRAVGDVSYESSDNAVATVDAKTGEVTIRGVGKATITAKVAETETHEAAEASYKLTVTDHDAGTWKTVKPATCTEAGEEQRVCGVCGEALETRAIEKLAHKASHTPATPATCTKDGNIEYWSCEACGKLFADAACTDEVERADTVVKATGHKLEAVAEVAATIDVVGIKAHYRCAACGELFLDAEGKQGVDAADLVIERLEAVTVTFDDCIDPKDDHVVVRIAKGGVVSAEDLPEDPQLAGYEFSGWFLYDAATGTWGDAFDPTAPVTSDLLVGAKWKKVDEGTGDSGSTEKPADKPAKPSDEPGSGDKDALVQTGDNAFVQIAAAFSAGVAAIGAGLFSRRRRNE